MVPVRDSWLGRVGADQAVQAGHAGGNSEETPYTALELRKGSWLKVATGGRSKAQGNEAPAEEAEAASKEGGDPESRVLGCFKEKGGVGTCGDAAQGPGTWGLATGQRNRKPGYRVLLFKNLGSSGVGVG